MLRALKTWLGELGQWRVAHDITISLFLICLLYFHRLRIKAVLRRTPSRPTNWGSAIRWRRVGAKASGQAFDLLYGLRREGPEELKKRIWAVRADEIRDVARDLLSPGKECLLRLGPYSKGKRKRKSPAE